MRVPQTADNIRLNGVRPDGCIAGNQQDAGLVSALAELVRCFCSLGLPAQTSNLADAARVRASAEDLAEMERLKVKEGAAKCLASGQTATGLAMLKSTDWD